MTEDEVGQAIEHTTEYIDNHEAMNPRVASQQDSIDFLRGVAEFCVERANVISEEMGG